jgi:hypothetical protein
MNKILKNPGRGKEYREGGFITALHMLPYAFVPKAREEICQMCYWSYSIFRLKVRGKKPFRIYEIQQIEKYFSSHNLNAWTGEILN